MYPKDHDPVQLANKKIKYQVKLIEVRDELNFLKLMQILLRV